MATARNSNKMKAWNKGRTVGRKPHLSPQEVEALSYHLQKKGLARDFALFRLAIDTMLRGCDLVALRVEDILDKNRITIRQRKTGREVQCQVIDITQKAVASWIEAANLQPFEYLFKGEIPGQHMTTRAYAYRVKRWMQMIDHDPKDYGTHSLRRTKAALIYERTKDLRKVQLLLGHATITATVKYLGIEEQDALETAAMIRI